MFIIYLHTTLHTYCRNGTLVITVKVNAKWKCFIDLYVASRLYIKWRLCRSHLTCSYVRHIVITDCKWLKLMRYG